MIATASKYRVWDSDAIREGTARDILEQIRAAGGRDSAEIRDMTVDQYATALIEDAPYFMDKKLLEALEHQSFASVFDKALTYLASSPSSRVRILSKE